jgi:hypothetical protein
MSGLSGEEKMNDREFAAAHDRYLEPPEKMYDDSDEDEDAAQDQARQRRLDEEDWIARKIEMEGEE